MKKIAVILCGSGYKDGSEIRESVAALWALSKEGAEAQCFAPDATQKDVVNCLTGQADTSSNPRNMRIEAARIARGNVRPLNELKMSDWDAVIIPGGFGVAKNLCTFAFEGSKGSTLPDLSRILKEALATKKPIGAICIAPAAVAIALKDHKLELTLGSAGEVASEIEKLGHTHRACKANEYCADKKHKLITTPAYMHDQAPLHEIFDGIQGCIRQVLQLI